MGGYFEFRYWSAEHDRTMIRLSMFNDRGNEFWVLLPEESPRRYRERREEALDLITQAIRDNLDPGQVVEA